MWIRIQVSVGNFIIQIIDFGKVWDFLGSQLRRLYMNICKRSVIVCQSHELLEKKSYLGKGGETLIIFIWVMYLKAAKKKCMQLYAIIQSTEKSSVLGNQILPMALRSKPQANGREAVLRLIL